jgi:flagellar FliL protein
MGSSKAAEADKDAAKPKKGKKKKLLMIVAVALLVVAGAGGYLMFSGGKSTKTTATKPKPTPGAVLALDAVTMNLAEGHYLKVKMSLQLTAAAAKDTDGSKALDLAITEFTDRPIAELSSASGRAKIKAELLEKLAAAYEDEVIDIYFTQFVMQ